MVVEELKCIAFWVIKKASRCTNLISRMRGIPELKSTLAWGNGTDNEGKSRKRDLKLLKVFIHSFVKLGSHSSEIHRLFNDFIVVLNLRRRQK